MNLLKIPEEIKGRWQHALILTYGLDIPFFENGLWRQFGKACNNKIILADGKRYLQTCESYANSKGLIRHLNQHYVAEGIFAPYSAHAKLILLANDQHGRLLVGSGNLGYQGYASGGEMFTKYEYSEEAPDTLREFVAVRQFIDGLIDKGYIGEQGRYHIQEHMYSKCPWLFGNPQRESQVRHNLNKSFIDQLQETIGNTVVDELWIMAPFYDEKCIALEKMLSTFQPKTTHLLIQQQRTSADPLTLMNIVDAHNGRVKIHSVSLENNPYLHTKMYLFKLGSDSICLQGSPNLSQVAMLRSGNKANVELANLLTGERDTFDYIFGELQMEEVSSAHDLEISYHAINDEAADSEKDTPILRSGRLDGDKLYLQVGVSSFDPRTASLLIDGVIIPLNFRITNEHCWEYELSQTAIEILSGSQPLPIRLKWEEGEITNPIFVCNVHTLRRTLEITTHSEAWEHLSDLDVEDEVLEELLIDLRNALIIEPEDLWQLAKSSKSGVSTNKDNDDSAPAIDYDNFDYEILKQHPKLQQYIRGRGGSSYQQTQLQIILSAITSNFRDFVEATDSEIVLDISASAVDESLALIENMEELEEEETLQEEERQRRQLSAQKRIRRILSNFIQRYLRGTSNPLFWEKVGFDVISQNYVIFSHIMWHLFSKEWLEDEFIIDNLLKTITNHWGTPSQSGYFNSLPKNQVDELFDLLQEKHANAQLIASIYHCARLTRKQHLQDLRLQLRDFWRYFISDLPFEVDTTIFRDVYQILSRQYIEDMPTPSDVVDELLRLGHFDTRDNFSNVIREQYNLRYDGCRFELVHLHISDHEIPVPCLVIGDHEKLRSCDDLAPLLYRWIKFDEGHGYYRIVTGETHSSKQIIQCDEDGQNGIFYDRETQKEIEIEQLEQPPTKWNEATWRLYSIAEEAEELAQLRLE
jgi:hypothetical protein